MNELLKALYSFWSSFEIGGKTVPAFEQNSVPENAAMPYITYEVRSMPAFGYTNTAAICWTTGEDGESGINSQMVAFADCVRAAIPEAGTALLLEHGMLALYRGSGDWLTIMPEVEQTDKPGRVLGLRVGYEAHFYTT